jgi:UDP-glucose 4-epimerase
MAQEDSMAHSAHKELGNMRILITGGTGNVAEYLIKDLEQEHELVLFDRLKPGEGRAQQITDHTYISGDLTNGEDCAKAVAGCQAIMHLGAIPGPTDVPGYEERAKRLGRKVLPYSETMRVNTLGTYELMRAAVQAGVKTVVAITSNCVLGQGYRAPGNPFPFSYLPIDEEHPCYPIDSYSTSKHFQSEIMFMFSRSDGIRSYAIRPAGIQRPESQMEMAKNAKPLEAWSDWIYGYNDISDVTSALKMCLDASSDLPLYDGYYICAADTTAVEDSMDIVRKFRPDLLDKIKGDLPGRSAFFSTEKARKAFG